MKTQTQKSAYLTIDDAPSKDFRQKVDFLLSKKIHAIFFCEGRNLEKYETDIIYAIKKGFLIGNHSSSHNNFSKLTLDEARNEIQKTEEIIDAIYKKAKIKRKIKLFRFPFGDKAKTMIFFHNRKSRAIQNYLKREGFRQPGFENINYFYYKFLGFNKDSDVFWTFDVAEWRTFYPENKIKSFNWVLKRIRKSRKLNSEKSSNIILMHDHEQTSKYFPELIDSLLERGIKFERINLR